MTYLLAIGLDLVLMVGLGAVFYRRHRRRDLVLAYAVVNAGVLAVTAVLAHSAVGAGLGLGLFGVLSIIRLRSEELRQHEIAYYFAALTIGLLAGFGAVGWWPPALMVLIAVVMVIGDHPGLLAGFGQQTIVLDRAIADEGELVRHVSGLLGTEVVGVTVRRLDLVTDSTTVDVRYRRGAGVGAGSGVGAGLSSGVSSGVSAGVSSGVSSGVSAGVSAGVMSR